MEKHEKDYEINIRNRIITEYNKSFFVEAGAGAGKTYLIIERIINQLEKGIKPESIVVITFTNMAAEELRERIENRIRQNEENSAIGNIDVDLMQISTIHSFCYRILKERCFDAKLPMDVSVIEEIENQDFQNSCFKDYLKKLSANEWKELDMLDFKSRYAYVTAMESVYKQLNRQSEDVVMADISRGNSDIDSTSIKKELISLCNDFRNIFIKCAGCIDYNVISCDRLSKEFCDKYLNRNGKNVYALLDTIQDNPSICLDGIIKNITESETKGICFKLPKNSKVALETVESGIVGWRDKHIEKARDTIELYNQFKYNIVCRYAYNAHKYYLDNLDNDKISNNVLIEKARDLIRDNKEAREYFASKFKHIYVDEFQDTDHIQDELIKLLSDNNNGTLFLVGDPKQSIYRFRGAQPEVYFETKKRMENREDTEVVQLKFNFRSSAKVISWINDRFKNKSMLKHGGYIPMTATKKSVNITQDNLIEGVYKYHAPLWSEDNKSYKKETDSESVAKLIDNLVNGDYYITDYKKNGNLEEPFIRKINYSDIMVLCRTKSDMKIYLSDMNGKGIPVKFAGEDNFNDEHVVREYINIYRYLANPYIREARITAIEWLKSNGISQPQLLLKKMKEDTKALSAYGKAQYLLGKQEYLYKENIDISRNDVIHIQSALHQLIESVYADYDGDSIGFADELERKAALMVERTLSLEMNANAVSFMNLHKAKGLEANIVIIANRKKASGYRGDSVTVDNVFYPSIESGGTFSKVVWCSCKAFSRVYERVQEEEKEESIRLEYVAATRAKQALVVMDSLGENSLFGDDYDFITDTKSVMDIIDVEHINCTESGNANGCCDCNALENGQIESAEKARDIEPEAPYNINNSAVIRSVSPSDYEKTSKVSEKCYKDWKDNNQTDNNQTDNSQTDSVEEIRPRGNIAGTVMHRALELLIERAWNDDDAGNIEIIRKAALRCVIQAMSENIDDLYDKSDEQKEHYKNFFVDVLCAFWKWNIDTGLFINACDVYTELPFSYYEAASEEYDREDREKIKTWMNGSMDLLIRYNDGTIKLIDYKSDVDYYYQNEELFEQSLKEKYGGQVKKYIEAVMRLFDVERESIYAGIVSFTQKGEDEKVKVRYTDMTIDVI